MKILAANLTWTIAAGLAVACDASRSPTPPAAAAASIAQPAVSASAKATTAPPAAPHARFTPAPHYASLFREGASWQYAWKSSADRFDPGNPRARHDYVQESHAGKRRCKVARVVLYDDAVGSEVECDTPLAPAGGDDPVVGGWVANAQGLFRLQALPENGMPDLSHAELVIASSPKAERQRPCEGRSDGFEFEVKRNGDAWCATHMACEGDDYYVTRCFTPQGIVRGGSAQGGGSIEEVTFVLSR
jgi:hypothetical protein